jgi:hypothetical protein
MKQNWLRITSGMIGLLCVLGVIFANQLGLDNNQVWGLRRYLIFFAGLFLLIVSVLYLQDDFIQKIIFTAEGRLSVSAILLNIVIILIYLWYTSAGKWEITYNETSYYDLLASAFRHGQLALEIQPDPALLEFKDERLYEPSNREGIPVLWDATLYEGKYYLYWGPAPALPLAFIKLFYAQEIGDRFLALFFLSATLIFLTLILFDLYKNYFSHIPNWAVLFAIALVGLINPMVYILVEGRIYEASIAAAQFFLMGGFYFLFSAYHQPNTSKLFLAGLFFALAIGSRTTVLFAVASTSLVFLFWVITSHKEKIISYLIAFALPLIITGVAYASYNYARFESFTEFGYKYQLTSYNLYEKLDETFSPHYIVPNTYKTIFNPLEQRIAFPYFFPTRFVGPAWLETERGFYLLKAESITGLLISGPFLLFAFLAGIQKDKKIFWVNLSLIGSAFFLFITLLAFFFLAMRYLLDFIPTLTLLAIIGFWNAYSLVQNKFAFFITSSILLTFTIGISLIISISGNLETFKVLNLDFIRDATGFFNQLFR